MSVNSLPEIRIDDRLRFYRTAQGKRPAVVAGLAGVTGIEEGLKIQSSRGCNEYASSLGAQL